MGRIPEDRHASLVGDLSVAYNLVLERLDDFRRGGRLDERRIREHADELIERFDIRARPDDRSATLSGGNIQKVLLARVLSRDPRVLVVSQPTRGLDVGATEYVRSQLLARRAAGSAILLVSEDLDELLALADRLVVLYEGRIVGEMAAPRPTAERLGLLMAGRGEGGLMRDLGMLVAPPACSVWSPARAASRSPSRPARSSSPAPTRSRRTPRSSSCR